MDGKAERRPFRKTGAIRISYPLIRTTPALQSQRRHAGEKSNEIKAVPILIDKIDISGRIVTADAMSMQKDIIERIRTKGGDFLIELKANQRSARYGVEDSLKEHIPLCSYTEGALSLAMGGSRQEPTTYMTVLK